MTPSWQHIVQSVRHPAIPLERVFVFPHSIRPPSAISSRLPDGICVQHQYRACGTDPNAPHTAVRSADPPSTTRLSVRPDLRRTSFPPSPLHHSLFPFLSAAQSLADKVLHHPDLGRTAGSMGCNRVWSVGEGAGTLSRAWPDTSPFRSITFPLSVLELPSAFVASFLPCRI